jgi:hypothetical protein
MKHLLRIMLLVLGIAIFTKLTWYMSPHVLLREGWGNLCLGVLVLGFIYHVLYGKES